MPSERTDFFLVSNCIRSNLPRGCGGYGMDQMSITRPWFDYFVSLEELLIKFNVINLVFRDYNSDVGSRDRLAINDKSSILHTTINKTFGFQKPYERLTIEVFEDDNNESCSFLPCKIPRASVKRRLVELVEDNLLARFRLADSRIGFFAPRIKQIFNRISPIFLKILVESGFNDSKNIENEDYYLKKKQISKKLDYVRKLYGRCIKKNKQYFFEPLSQYIDALNGQKFKDNNEACRAIEEISCEIFGNLNNTESPYMDISTKQ